MTSDCAAALQVPKRVEEALFFRLKQKAFKECDDKAKAYADCCRGRILSVAWACRTEAKVLSSCMTQYTSKLDKLKARWVAAGYSAAHVMSEEQWGRMLDSLLDGKPT